MEEGDDTDPERGVVWFQDSPRARACSVLNVHHAKL